MYSKIKAEFEIITPMFIRDGQQMASGVRPTSIKGALRFWWRALRWDEIISGHSNDADALAQLREEEISLFGGPADSHGGGQGIVSVRVNKQRSTHYNWGVVKANGLAYLLGIGLYNYSSKHQGGLVTEQSLAPESVFSLDLVLKGASELQQSQLIDAVRLFGLLGGLGSRNRKGFGSIVIKSLSLNDQPLHLPAGQVEYINELKQIFQGRRRSASLAPFTALSALTESDVSVSNSRDWQACLQEIGDKQQVYRSFGRHNKVAGKQALQLFHKDHDVIFDFIMSKKLASHPQRIVFGLPHNYYFSSIRDRRNNNKVQINGAGNDSRRASPLFIHVHKFTDGSYAAVQTLIPAQFYPLDGHLTYNHLQKSLSAEDIDWQVIRDYMQLPRYKSPSGHSYPGFVHRLSITERNTSEELCE
ncbi:type III-B CRISPR module RAMP protein Cmr1 [Vibrio sp. WXL210]|uniref:type III-B CRISPR module RAMP protein Cmr1 n=1 Tax=Vibrio sp. WXL210 TaxID=3450709 RepID=UPI003EC70365